MNPEKFSREEIEQRITALLLGELPAEEAALLRYAISQDAELAKLQERLKQTIDFTREAVTTPAEPMATPTAPLKLSEERRKKLLAHFKLAPPRAVTPEEMGLKRFKFSRVIEILVVVAIVAMLAAVLLPSLSRAKRKAANATALNEAKIEQLQARIDSENRREHPAPATPVPAPVAVAQPQPAPSTKIVLPKGGKPSAGSSGGVYSTSIVGYSTIPPSDQALTVTKAIPFQSATSVNNSGSTLVARDGWQNDKLGFDDGVKSLDEIQPSAQPQPNAANQGLRINNNVGTAAITPSQNFAFFEDGNKAGALQQNSISGKAGAPQNRGEEQKSRDIAKTETPTGGDLPVVGRLFRSQTKSVTPLPGAAPLAPAESPAPAPAEFYNGMIAGKNSVEGESNLSDTTISGGIALNGQNSFQGETTVNSGTLKLDVAKAGADTLTFSEVRKDDVSGLRFGLETNAIALNRVGMGGDGGGRNSVSGAVVPHILLGPVAAPTQSIEKLSDEDRPLPKPLLPAPIPQPEFLTRENAFSTFSLNVSDVSFKLAAASLQNGQLPDAASIRSEEFINAFDYRDPEAKWDSASSLSTQTGKMPVPQPVAFAWERARDPFAHNRDFLRFSIKTAAQGRDANRPLNIVLLLDNSGSMERADRVQIIREALRVLAAQLHPQDVVSVITFARTPRLWADGVAGDKAGETLDKAGGVTPEGGTNLEEAMNLAHQTALRHYLANGANRVVLLTDGAANLGNVNPDALKQKVESFRKQGVALDCFGIGWEGYNDDLLEELSSHGDGRYGFLNTPEEAAGGFAGQLAGALKVAAQDVKVQVEFNPKRVTNWRQIGYAKHQLTKQQFRDNTVDAGEIAAQEAGNALYTIEVNPDGEGSIATVRVRYKVPGTSDVREQSWDVPYTGSAVALEKSSAAMRLCAVAGEFSEWLAASPFALEVTPDELLNELSGVPQIYGADKRPVILETMIREAKSISGK